MTHKNVILSRSSASSHNIMMSNLYVQFKIQDKPYPRIWAKYLGKETVLSCVKQGNRIFQGLLTLFQNLMNCR